MNIYNNEFASCDKINRPGMGEFYQGSSIKLTEPTIKQKQARGYTPYKGKKYTTGQSKAKKINDKKLKPSKKKEDSYKTIASKTQIISFLSDCGYSDDVVHKCVNSDKVINCETAIEWCFSYGLNKGFNKSNENDITFKEMTTDEPEYDLYRDEQKYSKNNFKIGDRVEIYYKPSIIRNLKLLDLDYLIHKGYNNKKLGYITHIRTEQIKSGRKTFLPVSFKTCKIASITLDDNHTIDILDILLRKVESKNKKITHNQYLKKWILLNKV